MLTMADSDGNILRYTAHQRIFESKLARYRTVLGLEKKRFGIDKLEASLSSLSGKSNEASKYEEYLVARSRVENKMKSLLLPGEVAQLETQDFLLQEKQQTQISE